MAIEIVDLPTKNGDFHCYVSSPEGNIIYIPMSEAVNFHVVNKLLVYLQCQLNFEDTLVIEHRYGKALS